MNEGRTYRAREAMSTAIGQLEDSVKRTCNSTYHRMMDFLGSLAPQNLGQDYAFATGLGSMSQRRLNDYFGVHHDSVDFRFSFMSKGFDKYMARRESMIAEAKGRKVQEKPDPAVEQEKTRIVMRLHDLKRASRPVPDEVRNRATELGLGHLLPG